MAGTSAGGICVVPDVRTAPDMSFIFPYHVSRRLRGVAVPEERKDKQFFFEKKNQKTFASWHTGPISKGTA
jgi:hypothetical protein